jgi:hypothetical protein
MSLPAVETSIDQYQTIWLLKAGRNCSARIAKGFQTGLSAKEGNICLSRAGAVLGYLPRLCGARIAGTHFTFESPFHKQVAATWVFHLHGHGTAARVLHLKHEAIAQASAARVFRLNRHATEQASAPNVVYLNCCDCAPRFIHLDHLVFAIGSRSRLLFARTEIRFTCAVYRGLLNVAHVANLKAISGNRRFTLNRAIPLGIVRMKTSGMKGSRSKEGANRPEERSVCELLELFTTPPLTSKGPRSICCKLVPIWGFVPGPGGHSA